MRKFVPVILLSLSVPAHAYGVGGLLSPIAQGFLSLVLIFIIIHLAVEAIKKPKIATAMIVFFTLSITVGFGILLLAIKYTDNDFLHVLSAIIGLAACMKIIGLGEKFYGDKSDEET